MLSYKHIFEVYWEGGGGGGGGGGGFAGGQWGSRLLLAYIVPAMLEKSLPARF